MKFWQSLAFAEIEQTVELAKLAEEIGFHGVSFGDHLITTKVQSDQYLYTDDGGILWHPETHWPDPWVISAALARETTTLKFMTTVYILPLRDPFSAAKAISTAANLSNNRIALGAGMGWQKTEFDLVGQDFHTRGKRADEQLEVMKKLMSGQMAEHQGEFFSYDALQMSPGTSEPVPIYIGGHSKPALRRAARHDGWLGLLYDEQQIPAVLKELEEARKAEGTINNPFEIWVAVQNPSKDTYKRLADLGVTMVNGASFMQKGKAANIPLDEKRRLMETFAENFMV